MIAVGGSIGTGLFIGSGGALSQGGPAALLIDFLLIGFMVLMTVAKRSAKCPSSTPFPAASTRLPSECWIRHGASRKKTLTRRVCLFIDVFSMGWNYVFGWIVVLPLEITAAGITVSYWPNNVPLGVWITIFYVRLPLLTNHLNIHL
jgi:amino acid transporter